MPYFDKEGTPYKEKLGAAKTAVRLTSVPLPPWTLSRLVLRARRMARREEIPASGAPRSVARTWAE
jgi:hypothetical protein